MPHSNPFLFRPSLPSSLPQAKSKTERKEKQKMEAAGLAEAEEGK